jgi:hypothetical protein
MAYYDLVWYVNAGDQATTGYYAVPKWAASTAVTAATIRRQLTVTAGNERTFVCIQAGTTGATEPSWVITHGGTTNDGTAKWMEASGQPAFNGDQTNTPTWSQLKANVSGPSNGSIIRRNSGTSYHIATASAGAVGATEPAFSDTAGTTVTDGVSNTWMSLGPVGNFTGGMAPFARLSQACLWMLPGNTIFVGNNHAETLGAQINLNPNTTQTTVGRVLCFNAAAGNYPPTAADLTTGATVATTTVNVINISAGGSGGMYYYGVAFRAGVGQSSQLNITINHGGCWFVFDNCVLDLATTGSTNLTVVNVGQGTHGVIIFNNTQVKFGHTAQRMSIAAGTFIWQSSNQKPALASGSAIPVNFMVNNTGQNSILMEGLDLSLLDATSTIWAGISQSPGSFLMKDCKLHPAVTVAGLSTLNTGVSLQSVSSANDAAPYKSARYTNEGSELTETTITRDGGAQDPTGQKQSRRIITNTNGQWLKPFNAEPYAVWNDRINTDVTLTVCGIANGNALPNNDDVWLDVEYHGATTNPIGSTLRTTKANVLAASTPVPADTSVWSVPSSTNNAITFSATTAINTSLSNGNRTATHTTTTNNSGVSGSPVFVTSGKFYFEITANVMNVTPGWSDAIGAVNSNGSVAGVAGSFANSLVIAPNGQCYNQGSAFGSLISAILAGDVISVALDLDARLGWIRKGGGPWFNNVNNNPITGVGGAALPAGLGYTPVATFNNSNAVGSQYTVNCGQAAFAYPAPGGFNPVWTPFKLTATLSSPQPGLPGYIHVRPRVGKQSFVCCLDPQINLS